MTDKDLKRQVENALDFDPGLDATDIGVSVDEAVVTLRGNVPSYSQKVTAERVAAHVYGVKAVANDLVVHLTGGSVRTDTEIAHAAVVALKWNAVVPRDTVTAIVTDGWVTLNGKVHWNYQRDAAARAVRDLVGVKGITNDLVVQPQVHAADVTEKIEAAFKRSAELDARRISVITQDGTVVLTGNVHSWAERQEAERAAWAAPGVRHVDDRLAIVP
jgi:osmotically-inducible protein OsmY